MPFSKTLLITQSLGLLAAVSAQSSVQTVSSARTQTPASTRGSSAQGQTSAPTQTSGQTQTTQGPMSIFFPLQEVRTFDGSVVASDKTATTYELSCPSGVTDKFICDVQPLTVIEGISRMEWEHGAHTSGTQTTEADHISCTVNADKRATCTGKYPVPGTTVEADIPGSYVTVILTGDNPSGAQPTATNSGGGGNSTEHTTKTKTSSAVGGNRSNDGDQSAKPSAPTGGATTMAGSVALAGAAMFVGAVAFAL